jgi:L-ornithine N5-oxygenase
MDTGDPGLLDVVGVGFGPSNLALAIALAELGGGADRPRTLFFERQASFGWHRNMLLPSVKMQVSFLKDLVTFRDPGSRYSFVSYLHAVGRLAQFVNNADFFPTREEFHRYLEWVEVDFRDRVAYGTRVTGIELPSGADRGEPVDRLRVRVDASVGFVEASNVVLATGLAPRMPEGVTRDDRVWHSSDFLARFRRCDTAALRQVAVVGAGQSAVEIVRFLFDEVPGATVTAVLPSYGYAAADNTPFANQVFDPDAIDDYYFADESAKDSFWRYHRNTNYGVVDGAMLRDLHQRVYAEEVRGGDRLRFVELARVSGVERINENARVALTVLTGDRTAVLDVDLVVFATGYEPMRIRDVLGPVDQYCVRDDRGRYRVERDFRLTTTEDLRCGIYLQGGTEHTHGLSASLLSNVAVRSGDIAASIRRGLRSSADASGEWRVGA